MNHQAQKINLFMAIFHSIFTPQRYYEFAQITKRQIILYLISVSFLSSFFIAMASFEPLKYRLVNFIYHLKSDIPDVYVENGLATFPANIQLPYILKFNTNINGQKTEESDLFRYVIDDGTNRENIYKKYTNFIYFDVEGFSIGSANKIEEFSYLKPFSNRITKFFFDPIIKYFFGQNPMIFSVDTVSGFTAFSVLACLVLVMPVDKVFIPFPLPVFIIFILLLLASTNSTITMLATNSRLSFGETFKISILSSTPAILLFFISIFLLKGIFLLFACISIWILQLIYLISALRWLNPYWEEEF